MAAVTLLVTVVSAVGAVAATPGAAHAASEGSCRTSHTYTTQGNCNGATVSVNDQVCWDSSAYPVPKGNVVGSRYDPRFMAGDWQYGVNVWYSPTCQTNWAVARVTGGNQTQCGVSVSTKIRRLDGSDGGYQMWHAGWTATCAYGAGIIVSPMVWSPDNQAQACGSLTSDDQVACTVPL